LAAGYDLYSTCDLSINANERAIVETGIAIEMPEGVYGRVAPRSGLAVRSGISVGAGVIDRDYRGELKVVLFNQGSESFDVKKGDRIAQLVLERHEMLEIEEVGLLEETHRGEGGFGSTGV
jgi:dUTP pyrophosphatase